MPATFGRPYFVMELVKGVPITQYCDEHHLTPRERLELFVPVCHAVQHAHQKGIIHRDIKPSNVLVAEYDDRPVPKIIDFGVAKAIQQPLTERTVFTQLGQVVGTIDYMSPEQAKLNELDVDTRSDVYSLGVLLYELLTGQTPFDRERLHAAAFDELLRIIREEEPPKPSHRLSSSQSLPSIAANRHTEPTKLSTLVRGELDWIVMKALDKDRARRYETANAFAADVEHYLADEPVVACPPSAAYRFRKFARRNKVTLAFVGILALTLLIGAAIATGQAIRATRAEHLAKRQEQIAVEQQHLAQDGAQREKALRIEAEEQRQQAEANRQRAEANLRLALEALDEVYLRVTEKRLAGGEQPQDEDGALLESTLNFYERFAETNRTVPETRPLVEEVYAKLLSIRRERVEQFPHLLGYRRALAMATVGLASLLENTGRADEARETYEQAARLQEHLVDRFPAVAEYRADLATTHGRLASLLVSAGQDDRAEEHRREEELLRSAAESGDAGTATTSIQFKNFADTNGLELVKDAFVVDDRLRLAPKKRSQCGACWFIEKQPVAFGFETTFRFQLSGGADGFAFVIQNHELSIGGSVLGYEMPNSLAIEFDTYQNPYEPPTDHISVQTNGAERNSGSHSYTLGAAVAQLQLDDARTHTIRIRYVPGTLWLFLDESTGPTLTVPVELAAILNLEGGQAWVGFTAGTGADYQNHDILSWEFRPLADRLTADAFLRAYPAKAADEAEIALPAVKGEDAQPDALPTSPKNFPFLRRALAFYEAFAEQNPGGFDSQWEIGKTFLRVSEIEITLGQFELAERALQRAMEAFDACEKLVEAEKPQDASRLHHFWKELASLYSSDARKLWQAGQVSEAETLYRRALGALEKLAHQTNTRDDRWRLAVCEEALGGVLRDAGRLLEAEQLYRKAIAVWEGLVADYPNVGDYRGHCGWRWHWLANLLESAGRHAEAQEACRHVLLQWDKMVEVAPRLMGFHVIVAWDWVTCSEPACRNTRRAIEILERWAKEYPSNGDCWNALGVAYYREGDWKAARQALARGMELRGGGNSFDWFFAAMTEWRADRKEVAARWYALALRWMQENAPKPGVRFGDDQYRWGGLCQIRSEAAALLGLPEEPAPAARRGRTDALEFANFVVEADPSAVWAYQHRGSLYADLRQWEKAVSDFSKAVELEPENPVRWSSRARLYAEQAKWDSAGADLSKAVQLEPQNANLWYQSALAHLADGRAEEYRKDCAEMLERFGRTESSDDAHWGAWACVLSRDSAADWMKVVALAEKAAKSRPESLAYLSTLGAALYRAGRLEEAVTRLEEADRLYKRSGEETLSSPAYAWFFLAMACHCLGETEQSSKWLDKAVARSDKTFREHDKHITEAPWSRRLTLKLLRSDAEALLGMDENARATKETTKQSGT